MPPQYLSPEMMQQLIAGGNSPAMEGANPLAPQVDPSFGGLLSPATMDMMSQRGPVWDRVNTLRRMQDQEASGRAAGNIQADDILRQAATPHMAGVAAARDGNFGPGAVGVSMLPDQSTMGGDAEFRQFLEAREGRRSFTGAAPSMEEWRQQKIADGNQPGFTETKLGEGKGGSFIGRTPYEKGRGDGPHPQAMAAFQRQKARRETAQATRKQRFEESRPLAPRELFDRAAAGQIHPAGLAMMGIDPRGMPQPGALTETDRARLEAAAAMSQSATPTVAMQGQKMIEQIMAEIQSRQLPAETGGSPVATGELPAAPVEVDQINSPHTASTNARVLEMLGIGGEPGSLSMGLSLGGEPGIPSWLDGAITAVQSGVDPEQIARIILENIAPDEVEQAKANPFVEDFLRGASLDSIRSRREALRGRKETVDELLQGDDSRFSGWYNRIQ